MPVPNHLKKIRIKKLYANLQNAIENKIDDKSINVSYYFQCLKNSRYFAVTVNDILFIMQNFLQYNQGATRKHKDDFHHIIRPAIKEIYNELYKTWIVELINSDSRVASLLDEETLRYRNRTFKQFVSHAIKYNHYGNNFDKIIQYAFNFDRSIYGRRYWSSVNSHFKCFSSIKELDDIRLPEEQLPF